MAQIAAGNILSQNMKYIFTAEQISYFLLYLMVCASNPLQQETLRESAFLDSLNIVSRHVTKT